MKLKLQLFCITLIIMLFSHIVAAPQCYALMGKDTAYVFLGVTTKTEFTSGTIRGNIHRNFYHNNILSTPGMDIGIGVSSPIPLPLLSHLRMQVGYHSDLESSNSSFGQLGVYYDIFNLFNITPYFGASWVYFKPEQVVSNIYNSRKVYHNLTSISAGLNVRLPRIPVSMFAEYSYAVHGDAASYLRHIYQGTTYQHKRPSFGLVSAGIRVYFF